MKTLTTTVIALALMGWAIAQDVQPRPPVRGAAARVPAAGVSAMTTYNPDVQAGQIQGAAAQQAIDNAAAAASNARPGTGGTTDVCVLLGIATTLGVILAVRRRTT
jgi:hypothetical protein